MSDNEIIEQIRTGGQSELGKVYEQHRREFLQWIRKEYQCSDDDAKDIYQLTTLIFYENIKSGKLQRLVSSTKTYLFGIGKNIALQAMRKSNRITRLNQEQWLQEHLTDPNDAPVHEELLARAQAALRKLGQPCQQLIELFYYQRKTMEEITAILNYKNADTTKNQKYKCMARLRRLFESEEKNTLIHSMS